MSPPTGWLYKKGEKVGEMEAVGKAVTKSYVTYEQQFGGAELGFAPSGKIENVAAS